VTNNPDGSVLLAVSGDPLLGGSDVISTGDGNDLAAGGAGSDTVTSAGGNDILFGDGGQVTFGAGGQLLQIVSVDEDFGGNDLIDGGAGNDILIAGQGSDQLAGNLSEDLLFGGNAAVVMNGGLVQSIESDAQDLVTEALYDSFNASVGDEAEDGTTFLALQSLPGSTVVFPGSRLGNAPKLVPLLDAAVFQKLFRSDFVSISESPTHSGASTEAGAEQGGSQGTSTEQEGGPAGRQQGAPVEEQGPATELKLPPLENFVAPRASAASAPSRADVPRLAGLESHGDDAVPALMLGAAGLVASNRGGLLDRDAMAGETAKARQPLTRRALDAITRKWFGGAAAQAPQAPAEHRDSDKPAPAARPSRIEW